MIDLIENVLSSYSLILVFEERYGRQGIESNIKLVCGLVKQTYQVTSSNLKCQILLA